MSHWVITDKTPSRKIHANPLGWLWCHFHAVATMVFRSSYFGFQPSTALAFSEEASRELKVMEDAVSEILYLSIHAFVEGDLAAASRVEPLEEIIDGLCDELKLHHVDRLQKGVCTLSQGFVFNDLLTNYERVADHCSNIAVAMIELESDAFDTHEYLKSVKDMKSDSFARYYEEYSKKFTL